MIAARFDFAGYGGPWVGVHDPHEHWNGWAVPYFSLDVAREIVAYVTANQSSDDPFTLEITDDGTVMEWQDRGTPSEDPYTFPTITYNGETYHGVGAGCWVWDIAADDTEGGDDE